tara:strand:+ start:4327 stop:4797 length:471 start_codon:yes stop_codon:yes gene_type:complete
MNEDIFKTLEGTIEGVEINIIPPVNPNDPKGLTWELWKNLQGLQTTIYERIHGKYSGGHYHKGEDDSKDPERLFLISGVVLFDACNPKGEGLSRKIQVGTELIISPYVWHRTKVLSNSAVYVEHRSTVFDRENPDTYQENLEEYVVRHEIMRKMLQ